MTIVPSIAAVLVVVLLGPPPPRVPSSKPTRSAAGDRNQLVRNADGSYGYRNPDAGFRATIHADGTVTFAPIPRIALEPPVVLGLSRRKKVSELDRFNAKSNTLVHRGAAPDTKSDPVVKWGPYGQPAILVGFGGRFGGIADLVVGRKNSLAKRDFLARTAELRATLAEQARRTAERTALLGLMDQLSAIWDDPTRSAIERRRRIFEIWDDCLEHVSGASLDHDARAGAAGRGRRIIDAFIRRVAPAASRDGYSLRELDALNASRRSAESFDPYHVREDADDVDLGPSP